MINLIKQFILNNSLPFLPSPIRRVSILQLTASSWRNFDYGRLVYLIFINGQPKVVAKLYRASKYNDALTQEFEVLKYVHSQSVDLYPRPLTLVKIGEYNVLLETFIEGHSIFAELTNLRYLPTTSIKHLSLVFRNHFNIAYSIFSKQNIQNQKGSNKGEIMEIKNLIKEYARCSNAKKQFIQKIEATINSTDPRVSSKRIVHFNLAPVNIFKADDSYKLTDFECSQNSYLWHIEPAMFTFHYIGNLVELGFVDNTVLETMNSFRSNPKNIFEKEALDFCKKCFNNNPLFMQKAFILALIKSYILQKKVRSFMADIEEKNFTNIIEFWLKEKNLPTQNTSVRISAKSEDVEEDAKRLKKRIAQLHNQLSSITSSRGWKIATTLHAIRMKLPILNNL